MKNDSVNDFKKFLQNIEDAESTKELELVATIYFSQNPYVNDRDKNNDVVRAIYMKERSLRLNMNIQDATIQKINQARTIKELDSIASEYFLKNGTRDSHDVIEAVTRKEAELEWNELQEEVETGDSQVTDNQVVKFDSSKKKNKATCVAVIYKHAEDPKCSCEKRYGVPCIHRTHFDGIVPDDYEECEDCGMDHKYDPRLADEVHSKI